jgi:hypothetical protein
MCVNLIIIYIIKKATHYYIIYFSHWRFDVPPPSGGNDKTGWTREAMEAAEPKNSMAKLCLQLKSRKRSYPSSKYPDSFFFGL